MLSNFISLLRPLYKRPLLLFFFLFCFADLIFSELTIRKINVPASSMITLTGYVRDKEYDENDNVKSITVGNVLCYVNQEFEIGSFVEITGKARSFSEPLNRGAFNQLRYYRARNIDYSVTVKSIRVLRKSFSLKEWLKQKSLYVSRCVNKLCPFEAATINTLLTGDKRTLSDERKLLFQSVGISHFLIISGLHISAIGGAIYEFTRRLFKKRIPACISAIAVLSVYGLFVGFSVSVIRALIMFTVRLFSYMLKRTYDRLSALSLSGITVLIIYPHMVTDSTFLYSYGTLLIISFYNLYKQNSKHLAKSLLSKIKAQALLPLTITVFIMPVTLYFSGSYSIISVMSNMIIIPFSAPILITAFLALLSGVFGFSSLAAVFDFILHLMLLFLDNVFKLFSGKNFLTVYGCPPIAVLLIFYVIIIGSMILLKSINITPLILRIPLLILPVILCFDTFIPSQAVSMLYVGQGECLTVKTGKHSSIMSDCGSTSDSQLAKYTVIPFLKFSGINELETIYVSHSDADHTNAINELIILCNQEKITVKEIVFPDTETDNNSIKEISDTARLYQIPVKYISDNYKRNYRNLSVCSITKVPFSPSDSNDRSLVLKAAYPGMSLLLTGDISVNAEKYLDKNQLKSDVLKVAHHGSSTSTGEAFLREVSPYLAIISAGKNNPYNHPHRETTKLLADLNIPTYVTSESGEIDLYPLRNGIRITTFIH